MMGLKFIGVTLSCFTIIFANGEKHFNFRSSELKEKCNQQGESLFEDVDKNQKAVGKAKNEVSIEISREKSEVQQKEKLRELCFLNFNLKNLVKNLFNSAQLCLNHKEKFTQEDGEEIVGKMLEAICATTKYSVLSRIETKCFNALPDCSGFSGKSWSLIYNLMPLPLIRTSDECSKLQKYFECKLRHMNEEIACTELIRDRYNEITSKVRSLFICEK